MIEPGKWDYVMYQGATFRKQLTWRTDGVPVDLTNWRFRSMYRKKKADKVVMASFVADENFLVIGSPLAGTFQFVASAEKTAALGLRKDTTLVHDLEAYNISSNEVVRLLEGTVTINTEVTRNGD